MGPKKAGKEDGEDLSCEKFYAKYKKECQSLGFKPYPQVVEKYNAEYMEGGSNITKFNFWDEMGWQGVKVLMDSLRAANYQSAQTIRLWATMCEDEGCRAICRFINTCNSVTVLELIQNGITPLGCQFIGQLVNPLNETKCNLTILKLDHNPIGSEGMMYLAEGLRQNYIIEQLSLTYCDIDSEGAPSIFEILLFQKSNLVELDLGGNHLRNEGTIEVMRGAAAAKRLKRLSIQDNQFMEEDDVLDAIKFCFDNNQELGRYNFKFNFIGDYGVERLCDMMTTATHVYDVEIPERISKKVMEMYTEVKNANKPKKGKGKKGGGKKKKK